jgi:hypothetical protein
LTSFDSFRTEHSSGQWSVISGQFLKAATRSTVH